MDRCYLALLSVGGESEALMVCAYGTGTWTWGGDAACWSGPFSYLAAELVSVGRKLTEGRLIPYILQRALLCQHQQTVCPLPVVTVLLPLWTNTGFEWDAVRDKWTVAPLKKSFMSVLAPCPPLSFLVTPSLPHPPPLCLPPLSPSRKLPPAQWGTTVCRERSYPLDLAPGVLIYFISHRFSILCHFFLSPTPSLPLPSFFLSTESFSSLIPYKHTNRISISQRGGGG